LPGGNAQIIEGMHVGEALILGELGGLLCRLIKDLSVQDHLGAVVLGVVDLNQGGGGGHDNGGGNSGRLGRVGQPLGVVARVGGNQSAALLLFRQGADFIVGSPNFVGPSDLHV